MEKFPPADVNGFSEADVEFQRSASSRSSRGKLWLGVGLAAVSGVVLFSSCSHYVPKLSSQDSFPVYPRNAAIGSLTPVVAAAAPPPIVRHRSVPQKQTHYVRRQTEGEVCDTEVCKSFADSVLAARAKNYTAIDPCTDFATYTCGNWYDTHDYREDQSTVSTLSIMADVNNALMRSILESPYPENGTYTGVNATLDKQNFEKLIAGYNSCINETAINELGAKPLQALIEEFEASFPVGSADLTDALIWLELHGASGIVDPSTTADDQSPDVVAITLAPGILGLEAKEYYLDEVALTNYTNAIVGMFDIVFGEENHAQHENLTKQVIDLEKKLSAASPDPSQTGDVAYYYNPKPIAEVDSSVPEISFSRLLKGLVPSNYTVGTVIVLSPDYFPQLSAILQATPAEAIDAYLKWVLIQTYALRLSTTANAPYRRLQNEIGGRAPDAIAERWRTCLSDVDDNLPWIESAFYVQRAFSPEAKTFGERVIADIENIFIEKLKGYEWMSEEVKEKATQKVLNMVEKIGYPDTSPNVVDPKALNDYYASLTVSEDAWFENGLAYTNFSVAAVWNALLKPTDKAFWYMTAPTVNAYFNPPTNEIAFPAGIMQPPVFQLDLPEYVSYGAFGAVSGHELTHAFDDGGSHYDENGAYRDWWDNSTLANFNNKTKCFVDQYSQYSITTPDGSQLHVNGDLTLGENIADGGGLSASFSAWQKRNAEAANQLLVGLEEYTREQLFYLSYGGLWCGKRRPAEAVRRIYADPHSPPNVRILGTLANQRGFKEAFNCAVKEPTCELW